MVQGAKGISQGISFASCCKAPITWAIALYVALIVFAFIKNPAAGGMILGVGIFSGITLCYVLGFYLDIKEYYLNKNK